MLGGMKNQFSVTHAVLTACVRAGSEFSNSESNPKQKGHPKPRTWPEFRQ
jgi:hypothetical protein